MEISGYACGVLPQCRVQGRAVFPRCPLGLVLFVCESTLTIALDLAISYEPDIARTRVVSL